MVAGEMESSCQSVVTLFFFFSVSPYQTIEISLGQPSPPSYQLLPPPLGRDLLAEISLALQISLLIIDLLCSSKHIAD